MATSAATGGGGAVIKVARLRGGGHCIRVEGRGTMRESRPAHDYAEQCLADPGAMVAVDLSDCTYLDSTFLGSLLDLHRRSSKELGVGHFVVHASPDKAKTLFGAVHLNKVFTFKDEPVEVDGDWLTLARDAEQIAPEVLAKHVMQCHRLLAETDGPQAKAFAAIADQLERDLARQRVEG